MMQTAPYEAIKACRCCGSEALTEIIHFGTSPIADNLRRPDDHTPEFSAPLSLLVCGECGMCQIRETVEPRVLFGADYPYYSSVSQALLDHFHGSANEIIRRYDLGADDLVIEAASNDGYMLSAFDKHGIGVLGIDPADGPVAQARARGIETRCDFFTEALAAELAGEGRQAKVFLANNVLAHVADVNDFVRGITRLLTDDGVAVLEFPYLLDLVNKRAFDTIYHQHLLYISVAAAEALFARHGLFLNDVERTRVHGGSLRVTVTRSPGRSERLEAVLEDEAAMGMSEPAFFDPFVAALQQMRRVTREELSRMIAEGQRVVGYGAAAKATTLLQYFGLDRQHLEYIIDKSTWKQGLEMPGVRIPIVAPEVLKTDKPDVILILAWNFANEIVKENKAFIDRGGQFLIPVPELRLVEREDLEASL